uniref:AsIV-cont00111-ORF1 n=1 Tax=Apophua simplicipes ichnovirus TaxID=1329648 RepID=S5DMP6_9VIRU|nr:AsIV-cont00111-ORF1 [Apophua simplicipes ichnovirus]
MRRQSSISLDSRRKLLKEISRIFKISQRIFISLILRTLERFFSREIFDLSNTNMDFTPRRKPNLAQLKRIYDLIQKIQRCTSPPGAKLNEEDSESERAKMEEKRKALIAELRRLANKYTELPISALRILNA